MSWPDLAAHLSETWPVWAVSLLVIYATWIDATELRVPNALTYPMILAGLAYNCVWGGGWAFGLLGMLVGLMTLLPLYAVGGMGSGDVKLMAGIGAWLGVSVTFWAFAVTAVVGAVMAVAMMLWGGKWAQHVATGRVILAEWKSGKGPRELSALAAERKPTMTLLPYGIPICVGSLGYFAWAGLY